MSEQCFNYCRIIECDCHDEIRDDAGLRLCGAGSRMTKFETSDPDDPQRQAANHGQKCYRRKFMLLFHYFGTGQKF